MVDVVLASASPARLTTLTRAGITPRVPVSHVDEDAILSSLPFPPQKRPAEAVSALAVAKAREVANQLSAHIGNEPTLVIGCDSMLEFDGEILGKPHSADVAVQRWRRMRGQHGHLHTGHHVILIANGTHQEVTKAGVTTVWFSQLTDEEITAYVATEEPLHVAGAFTIDGLGGAFIDRIDGDHHLVVGLSLPLLRSLVTTLGVPWTALWDCPPDSGLS